MKFLLSIFLFGLTITGHASQEWRTFTSVDGKRTFVGQLTAFDHVSETVTVVNANRQRITFKLDLISENDRDYVETNAAKLKPDANLQIRFEELRDHKSTARDAKSRTKTHESGYTVFVNSYSPQMVRDAKVEYLMVYRKDQVSGGYTDHVIKGSQTVDVIPNSSAHIETQTVELVNYFKGGSFTGGGASGGGCSRGGCGGASSSAGSSSRAQRSRDFLIGCVARVIVNDQVVSVSATSPDLLRKYEAELGNDYENQASR